MSEGLQLGVAWALILAGVLGLVWAINNNERSRRPRVFTDPPPVEVRAVFDRRGDLWTREDDAGTYWTSRGLRCHVLELMASRGPLVEIPDARWRR